MPDHLHLMIKIRENADRVALGVLVSQLSKALRAAYWNVAPDGATRKTLQGTAGCIAGFTAGFAGCAPAHPCDIFEPEWHDWIVKKNGQLAAFRRYIRENPERAWLRRQNAAYFGSVTRVSFLGRTWFAYGNKALLDLPMLIPIKGHRSTSEGSPQWNQCVEMASRIGPGGAAISTFMSPLEKACGNAVFKAGGKLIVLFPEGFGERWHPTRERERLCAQGRILFLSLYEATARQLTRQELYDRCHEMIDLVILPA